MKPLKCEGSEKKTFYAFFWKLFDSQFFLNLRTINTMGADVNLVQLLN